MKTYSGERIPSTVRYKVFAIEGKQSREVLLDQHLKIGELVTEKELSLRTEVAYRISIAILIDFTGDIALSESCFKNFKHSMENLLSEDHWLLNSARIDAFLARERGEVSDIADYSFFDPIPNLSKTNVQSILF